MRSIRFSIAGLMGAVSIAALGLAVLRSGLLDVWAGVALGATCGVLGVAVIGVACRGATERAWWLGFAVFGWGYMALAFWSPFDSARLPTVTLLVPLFEKVKVWAIGVFGSGQFRGPVDQCFAQIAHSFWALLAAILGGMLATALFAIPEFPSERPATEMQNASQSLQTWWRWPALIGLSGVALAVTLGAVTSGLAPMLWAGLTFLLTWVLLGLAILGALLIRGRPREIWRGAALFGWGYLILAFSLHPFRAASPYLVTGHFLNTIRPWFPPSVSGLPIGYDRTDPESVRILKILERPVPMRFPTATSLDDVLNYIRTATAGPDGKGIPLYVDPIGLQEAETSLNSTITIDLEGVPLRTSLSLCLKQLGLGYELKKGFVMITFDDDVEILWGFVIPFLVVGHCLLALIAAVFGGAAVPLIAGWKRRTWSIRARKFSVPQARFSR
jgi:hypothetical protein